MGQKWGLGIWKVEIDVENVNDVWRRLTEDTKQMRYLHSSSEQGVWSIGHVVGSSLSNLKYSLTICRFLNRDFCTMLMDKCFHVIEFPVLLHYSITPFFSSISPSSLAVASWYCWYSETRSLQVQPCMGSSFFIYFYYRFILASIRGF